MPTLSFPCQECSETFESFHALQEHIAQHKWGPHKIISGEHGKTFVCLYPNCNKVIRSNRKVLRKHLISHQAPTHACAFPGCNRSFHERSKLKRHRLVHSGIKQYKCEHQGCGKTFAYKANMKTHMRTHTGQRPFKCTWPGCDKTFTQASNRSTHMNVHKRLLKRGNEQVTKERSADDWELNVPAKKLRVEQPNVSSVTPAVAPAVAVPAVGSNAAAQQNSTDKPASNIDAAQILAQFGATGTTLSPALFGSLVVPAQSVKLQPPAKACSPVVGSQSLGGVGYVNMVGALSPAEGSSPFMLSPDVLAALARYPYKVTAEKPRPVFQPVCTYGQPQPSLWFNQSV